MDLETKNGNSGNFLHFLIYKYGIILFFLVYAIIGIFIYSDYGCGPDEGIERQTSLVNFRYTIEKFNIPVSKKITTWLAYLPELKEYRDRYYGTAVHFPLVLIESFTNFTMTSEEFYGMRHFYTFLNYFLSMICFYLLIKSRFKNKILAFYGLLMMILSPRFFAESFYNNKDILFLSWYIFAIFFIVQWIQDKENLQKAILAGIILAFTCNTRFNGIALIPLAVTAYSAECIRTKKSLKKAFLPPVIFLTASIITFYIITPNFWDQPIKTLIETFQFNQHHPNHGSDGNLFFGQLIDTTKVWFYLPVWITLTVPTIYLLFSGIGNLVALWTFCKNKFLFYQKQEEIIDVFLLFSWLLPAIIIIGTKVIIYNGWRHFYFSYAPLVYLSILGINFITQSFTQSTGKFSRIIRIFVSCLLIITFSYNGLWIFANHPYEFDYFSPITRHLNTRFSGDYWGIGCRDMLRWITEHDPREQITIDHSNTESGSINRGLLPESDQARIDMIYDSKQADYILFSRDDKPPANANEFPGFTKVFTIIVDGDEIDSVFERSSLIQTSSKK